MAALAARSATSVRPAAASRRSAVAVRASSRPLWLPGADVPSYLNGTLAGDFGFDPLGLGRDAKQLAWNTHAELFHCRLCMTAVAGILIPDVLTHAGILSVPQWYESGKAYAEAEGAIPTSSLLASMLFMIHFVETKRGADIERPGSQAEKGSFAGLEGAFKGVEPGYPGGFFDPLNFNKSAATWADWKLKEVKNGRLAMMALLGFASQYAATGKGPVDNLLEHIQDPLHKTFADNGVSLPAFFHL